MWRMTESQRAHVRRLPGGGVAAIDVTAGWSNGLPQVYHGALVVERLDGARPGGYSPSVLVSARGPSAESVVRQLLPILECYPARIDERKAFQSSAETLTYAGR
jgi:hypothetical protein